jgi:deoxyribodipyrimidine photolyase-related protein
VSATAWVLGDQLSHNNPALEGAERVLMVESEAKLRSAPWHRQKLQLVLSAMRHFAAELGERGLEVDYRRAPSYAAAVRDHGSQRVRLLEPNSLAARRNLGALPGVELVRGTLFLTHPDDFRDWAGDRRRLVMEDFYRGQRRRLNLLMDGDEPAGGRWNFDRENRRPPPRETRPPRPYRPREDEIDHEVRRDLDRLGLGTFGNDAARLWPATRVEAQRSLERFVETRLADFGRWQDAMLDGERFMWHAHLSTSLNLGLLDPMEPLQRAERAYREGAAPIEAVEGFIRQIAGWREYVWGMYWLRAGQWRTDNALSARRALPEYLWTGDTDMRCVADSVAGLQDTGYAHHILRLMVFGNLLLLKGVRPHEAFDWFHHALIDGYECDGTQRGWDGHVRGRRAHDDQALRGQRALHRPHVGLLPELPL